MEFDSRVNLFLNLQFFVLVFVGQHPNRFDAEYERAHLKDVLSDQLLDSNVVDDPDSTNDFLSYEIQNNVEMITSNNRSLARHSFQIMSVCQSTTNHD